MKRRVKELEIQTREKLKNMEWNLWQYILLILLSNSAQGFGKVLDLMDLNYYEVVQPYHAGHYGKRNRRDLSTFRNEKNGHIDKTIFKFYGHNRTFILHIYKNKNLIADSFISLFQNPNNTYSQNVSAPHHCYYHGFLRNRMVSSAAVSTCFGLKGVIKDEDGEEFILEPHPHHYIIDKELHETRRRNNYILYKSRDLMERETVKCKANHSISSHDEIHPKYRNLESAFTLYAQKEEVIHKRMRRAIRETKYIEVVIVMDKKKFKEHGNLTATYHRGLEIMNFVDSYYISLNTRVAVVGVIVWNNKNMATVSEDVSDTLVAIEDYTREVLLGNMKLKFDNVQLISGQRWGDYAGLGGVGVICSTMSAAINRDHSAGAHATANTVAHELGHNIGFSHVKSGCRCEKQPCVMENTVPSGPCQSFADCTKDEYERSLRNGNLKCIL